MKTKVKERYVDTTIKRFEELDTPNKGWFTTLPQVVERCVFLEPNDKAVLMALMSFVDDNGHCSEYQMTIARKVRIKSAKTLRKSLDVLKGTGFISEVKHDAEGLPNEYQLLDWVDNPYLMLSEAVQYVETEVKKKGIGANKIAKVLDSLIEDESIYTPIIEHIENHSKSYELAVQSVCSHVNGVLGKSFDIAVKPKKVIPLRKQKTSDKGSFKKEKPKTAPRNREYIPSAANTSGKTVTIGWT